jgi:O-acetyl-ADP-ribose deacetylase (regulator of RNase III)
MIQLVEGDIYFSKAQAIAHGVAPNDDFKQGLALKLRERWPSMYKDFRHFCQSTHPKAGTLWTWSGVGGARVINLFTQEDAYGHHGAKPGRATLSQVTHCLKALAKEAETLGLKSVALPRLACGVGGMEWSDVEPLIREYLDSPKLKVYVYGTYRPGLAAVEDDSPGRTA